VEGCRSNRDCATDDVCRDGSCIAGCRTDPADTCPAGSRCDLDVCVLGCGTDDSRCGAQQVCRNDTCLDACSTGNDCGRNTACLGGACVDGCLADGDCAGGIGTRDTICFGETPTVAGACVQCEVNDNCGFGQVCGADNVCRLPCNAQGGCIVGVCDTADNVCVGCLDDTTCGPLQVCDTVSRSCVAEEALCAPCQQDAECGVGNLCLRIRINNFTTDRGCGLDCSADQACPSGATCQDVSQNGVLIGRQCVPANATVEPMSCTAFRNLEGATSCQLGGAFVCGAGAACVQDVCTVACATNADCPYGTACGTNPDGNRPPLVCLRP
jgi:hypothetical protein